MPPAVSGARVDDGARHRGGRGQPSGAPRSQMGVGLGEIDAEGARAERPAGDRRGAAHRLSALAMSCSRTSRAIQQTVSDVRAGVDVSLVGTPRRLCAKYFFPGLFRLAFCAKVTHCLLCGSTRAGEYTVILESFDYVGGCQSELADNLFEAGQDILRSRDLGFNSLDTAPRHRAVSDRPVTMACCGKDNEEKETGVRHTSTRAPGTIHEPAFEPRRPTILESITTKPGNRGGGKGNSRPITAPARGATAVDRASSAPRTTAREPRE